METGFMNRITGLVIALVVGGLLVGGLLIPSIEGMTATEKTFENEGYFHMNKYSTDEEITISWDPTNPKKITVNDVEYSPNTPVNQFVNIAIGDDWYFRYADGGANTYVQVSYGGVELIAGSNTDGVSVSVTCSGGTATITKASTTQTMTYTELYVISDKGAYVMKNTNEPVTVAENTEFIGLGVTSLGTGRAVLKVTGDVDNGATVDVIGSTFSEVTVSSITINATALTQYIGYELSTITFIVTADGTDYNAIYSYYIVPTEVTLELTDHLSTTEIAMFGVISILGIVALVVLAANGIRNKY